MSLWDEAIIFIYFFYGLAFYSLGLSLLVESGRSSQLQLTRSIRLLAWFGLLHGVHEWIDMFEHGLELYENTALPEWIVWLRTAILAVSFLALLAFGESLLAARQQIRRWALTLLALCWYSVSCVIVRIAYDVQDIEWAVACDVLSRYVIGIPGAMLACVALWKQRQPFREHGMEKFEAYLTVSATALALYGVFGQIFVNESVIVPSDTINDEFFNDLFGIPVQLFRAVMAGVVAIAMIRVLRALEIEYRQRIASMEQSKQETEQKSRQELNQLNEELRHANEETRRLLLEVQKRDARRGELLQRSTAAQEAERQRIARELHDETGQALTALAMGLRGMTATLSQNGNDRYITQLNTLEEMATGAVSQLRRLINDLRPPQLDDMGLVAALRWLVKTMTQRSGLQITLEVKGEPTDLQSEVETTLFRIVQEGLNNVVKHAEATTATVVLCCNEGITLEISDNGVGFDPETILNQSSVRTSWGLAGIQERARLIHASFALESAPHQGTKLKIHLDDLQF